MVTLNVGEIMSTNLKTLREDDGVSVADWEMALDEIRHILVVDAQGKLVGIVSDRDVLRASRDAGQAEVPVGRIMCRDVKTVSPSTKAANAVEKLLEFKIDALPVVDDAGRPIGIVTSTDFLEVARWALFGLDSRAPHARGQRPLH
jgi:CBS domain-containing membrane protein